MSRINCNEALKESRRQSVLRSGKSYQRLLEGHVWTHVTSHLARYARYVTVLLLRLSTCLLPWDQGYCNCSFPSSWIEPTTPAVQCPNHVRQWRQILTRGNVRLRPSTSLKMTSTSSQPIRDLHKPAVYLMIVTITVASRTVRLQQVSPHKANAMPGLRRKMRTTQSQEGANGTEETAIPTDLTQRKEMLECFD